VPAVPGLVCVIAGVAVIASAAGAWAQQTEQLSLPNVTVTAPAAPGAALYQTDDAEHGCDGTNDGLNVLERYLLH